MTNEFSVALTYRRPGTRPPIFVAGTFTEPPWTPQEMECTADENGEMIFSKTCRLKPGEDVQYKFRVGTGNWWVLDETSPTANDSQGNVNNVLRVPISAEDDAQPGWPRTSTSAISEGGDNGGVNYESTTSLLRHSGKENPTYGTTSQQGVSSDDAEAARGQSELRGWNGPINSAADADHIGAAKTTKRGSISRIFRRIWAWVIFFFSKLFRRNAAWTEHETSGRLA